MPERQQQARCNKVGMETYNVDVDAERVKVQLGGVVGGLIQQRRTQVNQIQQRHLFEHTSVIVECTYTSVQLCQGLVSNAGQVDQVQQRPCLRENMTVIGE